MATNPVELSVKLMPVGRPWVRISIDKEVYTEAQLVEEIVIHIKFQGTGITRLNVEHFNKSDSDSDTAVIIDSIGFYGITDSKFVWSGVYRPQYPVHYQDKISELPGQGYLGWNGVYSLEFDIPVFTWIHRILNMGWLYN